ncbi:4589_t:CDS:2 [Diversispora eburnea]|uniref:4589_t:CDS:1 n=1 Tax=Diversispora eburnea TaxID=1213867 RepID=A0A9N9ATI7_9GLOM|nr:4589_t:CDS:2 [Diversispora eburnea]
MSIKLEGSETSTVTRETRQTSQINMIFTYIDESLMWEKKEDIVKVSLSAYNLDNINIREAIHERYNAEIIGKDLFIKYDGMNKERIHRRLANSAEIHNPNWGAEINVICVVGGNNFRPDVGIWFWDPTFVQRSRPTASLCPPSNVWIEQHNLINIEYVEIAIPVAGNPFPQNPNSGIVTTPATQTPEVSTRAPYTIHLQDVNSIPVYYRMDWNEYLVLKCGWKIGFNIVLNVISKP